MAGSVGKDRLIVDGGDGTLHQVFQQLVRSRIRVALLLVGTANVLVRELGILLHLEAALSIAASGRVRRIYLGKGNDRYFHLMADLGLDAQVIGQVPACLKKMLGMAAY